MASDLLCSGCLEVTFDLPPIGCDLILIENLIFYFYKDKYLFIFLNKKNIRSEIYIYITI
jgi:hypothetical protein